MLASGRGTNLQAILDAEAEGLVARGSVEVVVSDREDSGALVRARQRGVRAVHVPPVPKAEGGKRAHEARLVEAIEAEGPVDLVVLAGFMRILTPWFVARYTGRLINIHPALLPAFPGADGQGDALGYGVKVTGCTTHFVDEEVDAGPIVLQAAVPVHEDDDRDALAGRILRLEHQLLPRTVELFCQDRLALDGRHVRIRPGDSWHGRVERVPEALYPDGF